MTPYPFDCRGNFFAAVISLCLAACVGLAAAPASAEPAVEAFSEIRRLRICPLAVVNWKITNRLTLANPSPSGPTGQSGLELVYRLGGSWNMAAGAAYQSGRFRLSKTGPFPNGIAETNAVPAWGRVTCKAGKHLSIDLYGGAVLDGEMRLENIYGNLLGKDKYKTAPFAALAVTGRLYPVELPQSPRQGSVHRRQAAAGGRAEY